MLRAVLPACCAAGDAYGDGTVGAGVAVNVEYVSANPTGPMHVGHCRGAVVGDALANLLAQAGYAVTKEYYVNDAGAQVAALAWAAYWRYLELLGTPMTRGEFDAVGPGGLQYRGDYLLPIGEALADAHGAGSPCRAPPIRRPSGSRRCASFTIDRVLGRDPRGPGRLGVRHEVFISRARAAGRGAADAAIDPRSTRPA